MIVIILIVSVFAVLVSFYYWQYRTLDDWRSKFNQEREGSIELRGQIKDLEALNNIQYEAWSSIMNGTPAAVALADFDERVEAYNEQRQRQVRKPVS